MTLANYINELLYRYDCVIVPNFGGFVTNKIGAKINASTSTFYPPKKKLTFNAYLQHNDGLLANHIASVEKISFEKATEKISIEVTKWKEQLETSLVKVDKVGTLTLNEDKQLIFEPNNNSNFLVESFGLSDVESSEIKRFKDEVKTLPSLEEQEETKKVIPIFVKRVAVAAAVVGVIYTGWNGVQNKQQQNMLASQEKSLEKKIQSATFVIDSPLPTINLNVTKEEGINFYIVAGAFQVEENAVKKVEELKKQGFDAKILGKNSWGLTQVAFDGYKTKELARKELLRIKETVSEDAWLLEK